MLSALVSVCPRAVSSLLDTSRLGGFFLDKRMIISKCCKRSICVKTIKCGYQYYKCEECKKECDTTVSFLFPDEPCDNIYSTYILTDDDNAKV